MATQTHIIKKQVIDLRLKNQENAYQVQQQISNLVQSQIVRILDLVCSSLVQPDQYMRIDKLEIDLGHVSRANLEHELTEKMQSYLYRSLVEQKVRLTNPSSPDFNRMKPSGGQATHNFYPPSKEGMLAPVESNLELLLHFLTTGTLPWWSEKRSMDELEITFVELLRNSPEATVALAGVLVNDNARHRLIYQFSDPFLLQVIAKVAPSHHQLIQHLLHDYREIFKQTKWLSLSEAETRKFFWDAVLTISPEPGKISRLIQNEILQCILDFAAIKMGRNIPDVVVLLEKSMSVLNRRQFTFESDLARLIKGRKQQRQFNHKRHPESRPGSQPEKDNLLADNQRQTSSQVGKGVFPGKDMRTDSRQTGKYDETVGQEVETENLDTTPKLNNRSINEQKFEHLSKTGVSQVTFTDKLKQPEQEIIQEFYVENAGLILLWPYLGIFFKDLGLVQENRFINENAQMHAVHLLQYLVTGTTKTPEYLLVLNKLLCGWDLELPLRLDVALAMKEKSESDNLLKTVISHWSALKSTSIAGLQTSFLQRNGMLALKEKGWLLQVERKAFDLLLERLPWSISMIKLSWMKTLLQVEW